MNIDIYPKSILVKLVYLISVLLCVNIMGIIFQFGFGFDYSSKLIQLFDFNSEKNIPTMYSFLSLVVVSMLLLSIALLHRRQKRFYFSWLGLSMVFLFLSVDELMSIHERLDVFFRESLNTSGFFYYAWIIPYGVALVLLVVFYSRFLINLPQDTMKLFMISGSIFVAGAIGFEMLEGQIYDSYGYGLAYSVCYTFEEFFEMLGIAVFIYSLLRYMASEFIPLAISIKENN